MAGALPWHGSLSVLIYESSETVVDEYLRDLKVVFNRAMYKVSFHAIVPGSTGARADRADILETDYFDVVISDVSMGKSGGANDDGIQALGKIKARDPSLFCIAYTGKGLRYNDYANRIDFDLFIDKTKLLIPSYIKDVAHALREKVKVNVHAYVRATSFKAIPELNTSELIQLNRIVRKITYTEPSPDESLQISKVQLRRLPGGYSGAIALYMRASTARNLSCTQAVLKIARSSDSEATAAIVREARNYAQLVKWFLPYNWRPEMLGELYGGALSAICYAFVSSQGETLASLGETLRKSRNLDIAVDAIEQIFHPQHQHWYQSRNITKEDGLHRFYHDKCIGNDDTRQHTRMFLQAVREFDISHQEYIRFPDGTQCPSPMGALFARPSGSYLSCLVHGDMNSNNIVVSPGGSDGMTLIDFSSTGRGHVFFDFIVFEVSVRLDSIRESAIGLAEQIRAEQFLNDAKPSNLSYERFVIRLRQYARKNFPEENFANYLFGLAAFSFSMIPFSGLTDWQRRTLAACVCSSLVDLQNLGYWADQRSNIASQQRTHDD